MITTNISTNK